MILFDEPTSVLDPEMVKEVLQVMKSLAETGITMAIVAHEMGFVREAANQIIFLDGGRLIEDTTLAEFFTNPQSNRVALNSFYKNALVGVAESKRQRWLFKR